MPTDKRRVMITVDPAAFEAVGLDPQEAGAADVARALARYGDLLAAAGREVERAIRREEWCYLADCCNGLIWDGAPTAAVLEAQAADAHSLDGLGSKYFGDDGDAGVEALLAKLRKLTPLQSEAVALAVRWYWGRHEEVDFAEDRWWAVAFRARRPRQS